jgi:hypothetical protein
MPNMKARIGRQYRTNVVDGGPSDARMVASPGRAHVTRPSLEMCGLSPDSH